MLQFGGDAGLSREAAHQLGPLVCVGVTGEADELDRHLPSETDVAALPDLSHATMGQRRGVEPVTPVQQPCLARRPGHARPTPTTGFPEPRRYRSPAPVGHGRKAARARSDEVFVPCRGTEHPASSRSWRSFPLGAPACFPVMREDEGLRPTDSTSSARSATTSSASTRPLPKGCGVQPKSMIALLRDHGRKSGALPRERYPPYCDLLVPQQWATMVKSSASSLRVGA